MTKYIFVTGGVVSSLGKGIIAASLGRLLKNRGLKVAIQKFDPYLNVDPTSTVRFSLLMTVRKLIWTWDTTNGSLTTTSTSIPTLRPVRSTQKYCTRNGAATIWDEPFK